MQLTYDATSDEFSVIFVRKCLKIMPEKRKKTTYSDKRYDIY